MGSNPIRQSAFRRRGNLDIDAYRGKMMWKYREKMAIYRSRREAWEGNNPGELWISDLQPPEVEKINVWYLSYPAYGTLLWQP